MSDEASPEIHVVGAGGEDFPSGCSARGRVKPSCGNTGDDATIAGVGVERTVGLQRTSSMLPRKVNSGERPRPRRGSCWLHQHRRSRSGEPGEIGGDATVCAECRVDRTIGVVARSRIPLQQSLLVGGADDDELSVGCSAIAPAISVLIEIGHDPVPNKSNNGGSSPSRWQRRRRARTERVIRRAITAVLPLAAGIMRVGARHNRPQDENTIRRAQNIVGSANVAHEANATTNGRRHAGLVDLMDGRPRFVCNPKRSHGKANKVTRVNKECSQV